MTPQNREVPLLPLIEIPDDLMKALKGEDGILVTGATGSGKTHVLRRLLTLGHINNASRIFYDADLRGNPACAEVAETGQGTPVVASIQAMGAIEAWMAFSQDAGITLEAAKTVFPVVAVVERGKIVDVVRA